MNSRSTLRFDGVDRKITVFAVSFLHRIYVPVFSSHPQSSVLLFVFELWLLLLRREADGGKGAQNEKETSTNGNEGATASTAGALLRSIGDPLEQ